MVIIGSKDRTVTGRPRRNPNELQGRFIRGGNLRSCKVAILSVN